MDGISSSEAIVYGVKHLLYVGVVYLIGTIITLIGTAMIVDSLTGYGGSGGSAAAGLVIVLVGAIVIFGGLHGAIYKMAGDATARVMARSSPTAEKINSSDESSD
jgi:thiosulfate reductase cytochrome b subunit